ncbi:hypothetical protein M9H77_03799 [Catharanthus roseus]|uniref:Uncharacterized protein n=1 Tax=Catharanthus roseus TaxID=4058 RepID=A0ACC0CCR5_CATRO|nr:hypothetical protein M9H77_03799 [Catharanthus roseus]
MAKALYFVEFSTSSASSNKGRKVEKPGSSPPPSPHSTDQYSPSTTATDHLHLPSVTLSLSFGSPLPQLVPLPSILVSFTTTTFELIEIKWF